MHEGQRSRGVRHEGIGWNRGEGSWSCCFAPRGSASRGHAAAAKAAQTTAAREEPPRRRKRPPSRPRPRSSPRSVAKPAGAEAGRPASRPAVRLRPRAATTGGEGANRQRRRACKPRSRGRPPTPAAVPAAVRPPPPRRRPPAADAGSAAAAAAGQGRDLRRGRPRRLPDARRRQGRADRDRGDRRPQARTDPHHVRGEPDDAARAGGQGAHAPACASSPRASCSTRRWRC